MANSMDLLHCMDWVDQLPSKKTRMRCLQARHYVCSKTERVLKRVRRLQARPGRESVVLGADKLARLLGVGKTRLAVAFFLLKAAGVVVCGTLRLRVDAENVRSMAVLNRV